MNALKGPCSSPYWFFPLLMAAVLIVPARSFTAREPWIIDSPVTVTDPMEVGDVIILDGGSLDVLGVPEPGFRLAGNFVVTGGGSARFSGSTIRVMSTYHGQFTVLATEHGTLTVEDCDYRVPSGVQHALMAADDAALDISDTDFSFVQLLAAGRSTVRASRLSGQFECLVQDDGRMELTDIPRAGASGVLWVWPTFMPGSHAVYSPPLPGFVDGFSFPPPGSSGIGESFQITRCQVRLWPLLVREGSDLTLQDIDPANWIVVGLHLPSDAAIDGLQNGLTYPDETLPLQDRTLRLVNASVDTWNLYPESAARVTVRNSLIGELLAFGSSSVTLLDTTVDGSGGYFGIQDQAVLEARDCLFTCDVQAVKEGSAALHDCHVLPYPQDPTGAYTRIGAYDDAVLHLDRTDVSTTPALGGGGEFVVTWITDAPASPPPKGTKILLHGYAAVYTLDPAAVLAKWRLKVCKAGSSQGKLAGKGKADVEGGLLGRWDGAKPSKSYELRLKVKDRRKRTFWSVTPVPSAP